MPVLPDYTSLPRVSPQPSDAVVPVRTGQVEAAWGEVGRTLQGMGSVIERADDQQGALEAAYAKSAFLVKQDEIKQKVMENPKYHEWTKDYQERSATALQETLAMVKHPAHAQRLAIELQNLDRLGTNHITGQVFQKAKDEGRASFMNLRDQNIDLMSRTADPMMRGEILKATQDALLSSVHFSEQEKRALARNTALMSAEHDATNLLASDPLAAARLWAPAQAAAAPASGVKIDPAVEKYGPSIDANAAQYGLDAKIMLAQLNAESRGDPNAVGPETRTGKRSVGIAQFQPDTAKELGIDPTDPEQAIKGQAVYMQRLLTQFGGDYQKALAAYNWGPGNVKKAVEDKGSAWLESAPEETKKYLGRILGPGTTSGQLTGWKPTGTSFDLLPPEKKLALFHQAQSSVQASLAQKIQDVQTSYLRTGVAPGSEALTQDALQTAYGPEKGARLFQEIDDTRQTGVAIQLFKTLPSSEIARYVAEKAPKPGEVVTEAADHNYRLLQGAAQRTLEQRHDDPVAFVMGNIPQAGFKELGAGDADFLGEVQKRSAVMKELAPSYGVAPVVFSKSEAVALRQRLEDRPWSERAAFLGALSKSVPDEQSYVQTIQQIYPDSPVRAMAGFLASRPGATELKSKGLFHDATVASGPDVARVMIMGEDLLNKTKEGKETDGKPANIPLPPDADFRDSFQTKVGSLFANNPAGYEDAYQAVRAYYVGKQAEEGAFSKDKDEDRLEQAIKAILPTFSYGQNSEVLIPWGMPEHVFQDRLDKSLKTALESAGATPNLIKNRAGLQIRNASASNAYVVNVGLSPYLDPNGRPVVFTVEDAP